MFNRRMFSTRQARFSRRLFSMILLAAVEAVLCRAPAVAREPVAIIFDTDIMGDVDDVGAVAVLHALADLGEARILAMGVSSKHPQSPTCLSAINGYFRRPNVPIGVPHGDAFLRDSKYNRQISIEFPHTLKSARDAEPAPALYRRVLARAADHSVVMVSVGQLTNFRDLLYTLPDESSSLTGRQLVAKKVKLWVCMGGKFPRGREANLFHDGPAAADAAAHWPTPIVFSGFEIGYRIKTGGRLKTLPASSPVRRAYQLYNGIKPHFSWDQTAVLYAVRGTSANGSKLWRLSEKGMCHIFPDGRNVWRASRDGNHTHLELLAPPETVAREIEELMLHEPNEGPSKEPATSRRAGR